MHIAYYHGCFGSPPSSGRFRSDIVSLARWQILLILILTITSTAWAGSIYRWVDKDGVVHYSDHAPDNDAVKGDIETRQATAGDPSPGRAANGDQWSTDCGIRSGRIRSGAEGILTSWPIPGGISADDTRRWQPIPDGRLIRRAKESRSDDVEKT